MISRHALRPSAIIAPAWTALPGPTGSGDVVVQVSDPAGNTASSRFTLTTTPREPSPTSLGAGTALALNQYSPGVRQYAADTRANDMALGANATIEAWVFATALPDPSLNVLKGLIWCARLLPPDLIVGPVGRFSETCFRKVPMIGARSTLLGNACIAALSSMAEDEAATIRAQAGPGFSADGRDGKERSSSWPP